MNKEKKFVTLKKELSVESERANKKIEIKTKDNLEKIEFLLKRAEEQLEREDDESEKEEIKKEIEILNGMKDNFVSVH